MNDGAACAQVPARQRPRLPDEMGPGGDPAPAAGAGLAAVRGIEDNAPPLTLENVARQRRESAAEIIKEVASVDHDQRLRCAPRPRTARHALLARPRAVAVAMTVC